MAMTDFESVAAYLAAQPRPVEQILRRVRAAIRQAAPGLEESISYKIPTYKLDGKVVIYFAAWKQHFSLYPASPAVVRTFAAELAAYEVEKGTIRFRFDAPVPLRLIQGIARLRAKESAAKVKPQREPKRRVKAKAKRRVKAKAQPKRPAKPPKRAKLNGQRAVRTR